MPRHLVHRGRKIQVLLDDTTLPDGQTVKRDIILHPGAVAILPVIDDDNICLLRNHRFIVGEALLEIPAGTLEPGEPPDQASVRELAEETGYQAGRWSKLTVFYPSPGVLDERTHLYVARDLSPGPMNLEPEEKLEPQIVSFADALSWALTGVIRDAKTLIALLWWDRIRKEF